MKGGGPIRFTLEYANGARREKRFKHASSPWGVRFLRDIDDLLCTGSLARVWVGGIAYRGIFSEAERDQKFTRSLIGKISIMSDRAAAETGGAA